MTVGYKKKNLEVTGQTSNTQKYMPNIFEYVGKVLNAAYVQKVILHSSRTEFTFLKRS